MTGRGGSLGRLAHLCRIGGTQLLAQALERRLPGLASRLGVAPMGGPQRLRQTFERLGGTFLKLGQMLALQPDILSLEYCNALFDLMDRVPPFAFQEVERIVREELGAGPDELFDTFERPPLATASIGQVHTASLAGRRLAVKVQRPCVESEFRSDIRLMQAAIRAIRLLRFRPLAWLAEPLSEFVGWTREELDYRYEARYMEQLRANSRGNPGERVPELVAARTTRRVLSAELLSGVTVLAYLRAIEAGDELTLARVRAGGFEPERFAKRVIDNFLGDAFRHGVFHADLHPANLMILPDNVVGYIDFGITGVLSAYSRRHLVELTLAHTRGDLEAMADAFFKVSVLDAGSDPEAFREGLAERALDWYEQSGRQLRLKKNFTLIMLDMLTLSRSTGILPERDVVKYIRSAIAIDGLITRFAPAFDVGRYLEEVCERSLRGEAARSLFDREQAIGWAAAGVRLLHDGAFRAGSALHRFGGGDSRRQGAGRRRRQEGRALRSQAVQLAGLALALSWLMSWTSGPPSPGVNLLSAEALLVGAALTMLLRVLLRLGQEPGRGGKETSDA
jgi:ubiquinone biosynthesis protein